ncbi:hypothetical protein KVF89_10895 [Nocardioides carbamazepini]|uniref:hypothetical protein n=1 Tax=Nocardioides carbamazepini TaxID=2854259 RepID=UPI00214A3820|nr:hypothetical protein [Nocardioides carbamazepini]MCR1783043.1 hypothetical protein [Nocardioides carbamazepini]
MPSVRRHLPLLLLAVAAVLVAGFLVVRGGEDDPFADYCSEIADRREDVGAALSAGETTGLLRALPSFAALAEESPDDIRADWTLVVERIADLEEALDAAGVDPATYRPDAPPSGLGDDDRTAIETAAVRLGSQETATALARVEQQARDVCKTPLSL